jgi:hypothetical protein
MQPQPSRIRRNPYLAEKSTKREFFAEVRP